MVTAISIDRSIDRPNRHYPPPGSRSLLFLLGVCEEIMASREQFEGLRGRFISTPTRELGLAFSLPLLGGYLQISPTPQPAWLMSRAVGQGKACDSSSSSSSKRGLSTDLTGWASDWACLIMSGDQRTRRSPVRSRRIALQPNRVETRAGLERRRREERGERRGRIDPSCCCAGGWVLGLAVSGGCSAHCSGHPLYSGWNRERERENSRTIAPAAWLGVCRSAPAPEAKAAGKHRRPLKSSGRRSASCGRSR
jgi:hypothetical protein